MFHNLENSLKVYFYLVEPRDIGGTAKTLWIWFLKASKGIGGAGPGHHYQKTIDFGKFPKISIKLLNSQNNCGYSEHSNI